MWVKMTRTKSASKCWKQKLRFFPFSDIFGFFPDKNPFFSEKNPKMSEKGKNRDFCFQHLLALFVLVILAHIEGNRIKIGRVIKFSKKKFWKKKFRGLGDSPEPKNQGQILKNYFYRKMLSAHFKTIWGCFGGKMGMWRRLEVRKYETMNSLGPPP